MKLIDSPRENRQVWQYEAGDDIDTPYPGHVFRGRTVIAVALDMKHCEPWTLTVDYLPIGKDPAR